MIASASAKVVGSATVGPDPMTLGSSSIGPTTSDSAQVIDAHAAAAAQLPALDRRQVLAHAIELVNRRARRAAAPASPPSCPRATGPAAGAAISAEAPPDSSTSSVSSGRGFARRAPAHDAPRARSPRSAPDGRRDALRPAAAAPRRGGSSTTSPRATIRSASRHARSIGPAALPAAIDRRARRRPAAARRARQRASSGREQHVRTRGRVDGAHRRESATRIVAKPSAEHAGWRAIQERPAPQCRVLGVGPGREVGDLIELAQQAAHDVIAVAVVAELIEPGHRLADCLLHLGHRARRVVLALGFEALLVLEELFPVEIRAGDGVSAGDGRRLSDSPGAGRGMRRADAGSGV